MKLRIKKTELVTKKSKPDVILLSLEYPDGIQSLIPGQFFNIKVSETYDPFLRRPFSYCSAADGVIKFLYKVVGKGTQLLALKREGEILDIIGPFGNGFDIQEYNDGICLVAGGIGIAPLNSLAEKYNELNKKYTFIVGARTDEQIFFRTEKMIFVTEDGSLGSKGTAVEKFEEQQKLMDFKVVYTCGPKPMMAEITKICKKNKIKVYVCLETQIACGIGACLGCVVPVKTKSVYKFVCKDGPVFKGEEIDFDKFC